MISWQQDWIDRGIDTSEWPIVNKSDTWRVLILHRRTACENLVKDSKIWVQAPPGTVIRIEYGYGKGQAFDHANIYGKTDDYGYLWWYNAARTPGRMSVEVDGELLVENLRFDLPNEYCKQGPWWKRGNWNASNRPGQYVYDIEIEKKD